MRSPQTTSRMPAIDWLRVLAVRRDLLRPRRLHLQPSLASRSIRNAQTSLAVSVYGAFIYQWAVPLLFLLAGASSWFSLQHRTGQAYLGERMRRLLIPLLVGSVVLIPWIGYMSALNQGNFRGLVLAIRPDPFRADVGVAADVPQHRHGLDRALPHELAPVVPRLSARVLGVSLVLRRGRSPMPALVALCERRGGLLAAGRANGGGQDGARSGLSRLSGLVRHARVLPLFVYGRLFMTDARFLRAVERDRLGLAGRRLCRLRAHARELRTRILLPRWYAHPATRLTTCSTRCCWRSTPGRGCWRSSAAGCAGCRSTTRRGAMPTGAVLPFYILHQVAIATIGRVVVEWNAGVAVKFVVISGAAFVATMVTYECFVRRSRLLRVLFGCEGGARRRRQSARRRRRSRFARADGTRGAPRVARRTEAMAMQTVRRNGSKRQHGRRSGTCPCARSPTRRLGHPMPARRVPARGGRPLPGPRGYPLIGMLPDLFRHVCALPLLRDAWRSYGDAVQLPMGPYTVCFFANPDAVKHILVDNRDNYRRAQYQIRWLSRLMGTGLIVSDGELWRRRRHIMHKLFTAKAVQGYATAMASAVQEVVEAGSAAWRMARPEVELSGEMVRLSMDALGRSVLGFDARASLDRMNEAILTVSSSLLHQAPTLLPLWLPTSSNIRFRRAMRQFDELFYGVIRARRAEPETDTTASDVLSLMLRAEDDRGEPMSDAGGPRRGADDLLRRTRVDVDGARLGLPCPRPASRGPNDGSTRRSTGSWATICRRPRSSSA